MYEQSTGRFAQRGPESPESKRLCQVTMESLAHLPHTSTGGQFPHARFQTVERGIFPAGIFGFAKAINRRMDRATQTIPVQRTRITGDSAGSLMEYACLDL